LKYNGRLLTFFTHAGNLADACRLAAFQRIVWMLAPDKLSFGTIPPRPLFTTTLTLPEEVCCR
jgi:hypothetical protein